MCGSPLKGRESWGGFSRVFDTNSCKSCKESSGRQTLEPWRFPVKCTGILNDQGRAASLETLCFVHFQAFLVSGTRPAFHVT